LANGRKSQGLPVDEMLGDDISPSDVTEDPSLLAVVEKKSSDPDP